MTKRQKFPIKVPEANLVITGYDPKKDCYRVLNRCCGSKKWMKLTTIMRRKKHRWTECFECKPKWEGYDPHMPWEYQSSFAETRRPPRDT